ncbi:uncharacterized protein LOC107274050 isoform X2 [Cephus cinctus]|uniref:Uncharacterized protein LOC107274050 isoform X2 n=1 Tax=Cephus cinctus TaxID=211228 RepID=A0AAJ7CDP1_CEPCN|nr:uncharacterized protein LOC107274050 isoform X2 [Cephus cinctus]
MVDLSGGPEGPIEHGFSNEVFIIPAAIVIGLSVFFGFKLYKSLKDREKKREEKKRNKQLRKKK